MLCGLWSIKLCLVKNFVFDYPLKTKSSRKNLKSSNSQNFQNLGRFGIFLVVFIRFGSTQKQTQKFPQEILLKLI